MRAAILGAGFIGRSFIRRALDLGYDLRVLDHKPCPDEFKGRLDWWTGDFSNEAVVAGVLEGVDYVFHFISSTVPGDTVDESQELRQNVFQTLQFLKLCVEKKVGRLVFASSSSVYGLQEQLPISETARTDPISSHGIQKLTIEKYLLLYRYHRGLDCRIARISNPYGAGQAITGRQGLIAIALGRILAGEPVRIRGDGTVVRDFIHISDLVEGLHRLAVTENAGGVFNLGSGVGHTLNEVMEAMRAIASNKVAVEYEDARFVDIPRSVLDIGRAKRELGFEVSHSLQEGLAKTMAYHGIGRD